MHKGKEILIPLLAIGVVFLLGYKDFGWENSFESTELASIITSLDISDLSRPWLGEPKHEAWQVFQNYLEFARTHDLIGIESLSHQISATCFDPSREKECLALMDNVYAIGSSLKASDFTNVQEDKRQIIMFTDGPVVTTLYFTRKENGTLKVLGMRFCFEDETVSDSCVETNPVKRDQDNNGWWDSVESLFY